MKVGDGVKTWNQLPYVGTNGPTGPQGVAGSATMTGATGPMAVGTNVIGSYGRSTTQSIPSSTVTTFSYDSTYLQQGVSLVDSSKLTVATPGVYELITSIQVNGYSSSPGYIYVWIRKNGVDIADSAGRLGVNSSDVEAPHDSLVSIPYVISMNAGDYVQVVATTGSAFMEIVAFGTDTIFPMPAIPSITVQIKKVAVDIGVTGPRGANAVNPVSMLAYFTNDDQSLPSGSDTLVYFNQVDTVNTVGTTGLVLSDTTYVFTNTTATSIPVLINWYLAFTSLSTNTLVYTYAGLYINASTLPTYRQGETYSDFTGETGALVASSAVINYLQVLQLVFM
jgi:hypothetical protein